ncbi:hypothetical protein PAECIP111890_02153 [Paenibacillus sp. JJ-223]|nr:hypothetical protein PAECIP111890_02153 [Paenibacillus sp. JJ-223]
MRGRIDGWTRGNQLGHLDINEGTVEHDDLVYRLLWLELQRIRLPVYKPQKTYTR